ncbi:dihydrofolate reductase family protein [Pseudonocardia humida]|uniref:Dihydrofolate reductase family protein n=1 Tax=Pseudonocardia humida TaxID=2800819 RepID=A0ABT1A8U1_9PSEU|nr:dihydrofolate reductase family protein [Pseudonocardia humida]MCO1659461.1 dihydrofolate reductase family protein [Pseudonocardia humida]
MRKLVVAAITSLDGYCEGPGGDVMVLPMDHTFDEHNAERLRSASTLLLGRNTFQGFLRFWPPVAADPAERPVEREISRRNSAIEKVVVSDGLTPAGTGVWAGTTRIVSRAQAHAEVAALKEGDGGDVLVFGSRTMWHDLLRAGLVDELYLMVGPVVLGGGSPTLPVGAALRLLEARTRRDSDNVLLRYDARPTA